MGRIAEKDFPECEVLRIQDDLNDADTRKIVARCKKHHRLGNPVLVWTSLPYTGVLLGHMSTLITLDGNVDKVFEARRKFNMLCAPFVDLRNGLTACQPLTCINQMAQILGRLELESHPQVVRQA